MAGQDCAAVGADVVWGIASRRVVWGASRAGSRGLSTTGAGVFEIGVENTNRQAFLARYSAEEDLVWAHAWPVAAEKEYDNEQARREALVQLLSEVVNEVLSESMQPVLGRIGDLKETIDAYHVFQIVFQSREFDEVRAELRALRKPAVQEISCVTLKPGETQILTTSTMSTAAVVSSSRPSEVEVMMISPHEVRVHNHTERFVEKVTINVRDLG